MENSYDLILEFERLLSNQIRKLNDENERVTAEESLKRQINELLRNPNPEDELFSKEPEEIQSLCERVFAQGKSPDLSKIRDIKFSYMKPIFRQRQTDRYKEAKKEVERIFSVLRSYTIRPSRMGLVDSNNERIDAINNSLDYFSDGKVIKLISDLQLINPIIDEIYPSDKKIPLVVDILKSNNDMAKKLIAEQQQLASQLHQQQELNEVEVTLEEMTDVSIDTPSSEEELQVVEVEEPIATAEERMDVAIETVDQNSHSEEETLETINLTDEQLEFFTTVSNEVSKRIKELKIYQPTRDRIGNYIGYYKDRLMSIDEIRIALSNKKHYEVFLLSLLSLHISNIIEESELATIVRNEGNPKDEKDAMEEIDKDFAELKRIYEDKYKPLCEEILTGDKQNSTNLDITPQQLSVIFVDYGKPFEKSMKKLSGNPDSVSKVIKSLSEGHTSTSNPYYINGGKSGFYLKGSDVKVLYKRYGEHVIIHSVCDTNNLNTIGTVSYNSRKEEEAINNKDANYRKMIKCSNEILAKIGQKSIGSSSRR